MSSINTKPTFLVILDGFGFSKQTKHNAIAQAKTPQLDYFYTHYPHTTLLASGPAVGLSPGVMGNSEVGHLTIGAGRIIKQDAVRIEESIKDGTFFSNPVLTSNLKKLAQTKQALHCMGLLSDGGVHSNEMALFAVLQAAKQYAIKDVFIHAFLDGRDVPPQSAKKYLHQLEVAIKTIGIGTIGSITGRFYAMDRDRNWSRIEQAYQSLTQKQEVVFTSWHEAIDYYYSQSITDEFIPPTQLNDNAIITNRDGVIFFNYRPDRARQLTQSFVDPHFDLFARTRLDLNFFITFVDYDNKKFSTEILFSRVKVSNTLSDVLCENHKTIFAIAETEKYAHVTYFFNGGREEKLPCEIRILIPSIPAKNYVEHYEMSAEKITQTVIHSLETDPKDFYLINYANADMVGHSGNFLATVKSIEYLDKQLKMLYDYGVQKMNGTLLITGDHGKAEEMVDPITGQPKTSHTTNPVPFLAINKELKNKKIELPLHGLSDIASYILQTMAIETPSEWKK